MNLIDQSRGWAVRYIVSVIGRERNHMSASRQFRSFASMWHTTQRQLKGLDEKQEWKFDLARRIPSVLYMGSCTKLVGKRAFIICVQAPSGRAREREADLVENLPPPLPSPLKVLERHFQKVMRDGYFFPPWFD